MTSLGDNLLLLDGAMATFTATGVTAFDAHLAYIAAGANIITADTMLANRLFGLDDVTTQVRQAVKSALRAVEISEKKGCKVAASIPPVDTRKHSPKLVTEAYAEQIQAAVEAGAHFLLLETFHNLTALRYAIDALPENAQVMVSFSCRTDGTLSDGTTLREAAQVAERCHPIAIGLNCCEGATTIYPLVLKLAEATRLPLIVYPSAGLPDEHGRYPETPEIFLQAMRQVAAHPQVRIIGGCCGTTPEHISALTTLKS